MTIAGINGTNTGTGVSGVGGGETAGTTVHLPLRKGAGLTGSGGSYKKYMHTCKKKIITTLLLLLKKNSIITGIGLHIL